MPYYPPPSSGGGSGDALTTNPLSQFAATTSAQFKGVISDENAPDGASSKVIMALGSLSVASGKTLTSSKTLTLDGTDGTTMTFPSTSATVARTDAANTFTGVQTMTSPALTTPVLGTPTSGTLTNCTIPTAGISDLGTNVGTFLTTPTSANLAAALTNETGSGAAVFATSPTLVTPVLGTPSSGNLGSCTIPDSVTVTHDLTAISNVTGGWNEYFVTGSDFTTTNLTATDITGLVTDTLSASTLYEFEFVLRLLNAADTTGMKTAFHGGGTGSAATVFVITQSNGTSASNVSTSQNSTIDSLGAAILTYSGGEGMVLGRGHTVTRSTGTPTFSVQIAKVTSNTATVRVGSVLRIRKAHT